MYKNVPFYHVLLIAKFGQISLLTITTLATSQNWEKKKKKKGIKKKKA
jgi:hypothetical protein